MHSAGEADRPPLAATRLVDRQIRARPPAAEPHRELPRGGAECGYHQDHHRSRSAANRPPGHPRTGLRHHPPGADRRDSLGRGVHPSGSQSAHRRYQYLCTRRQDGPSNAVLHTNRGRRRSSQGSCAASQIRERSSERRQSSAAAPKVYLRNRTQSRRMCQTRQSPMPPAGVPRTIQTMSWATRSGYGPRRSLLHSTEAQPDTPVTAPSPRWQIRKIPCHTMTLPC